MSIQVTTREAASGAKSAAAFRTITEVAGELELPQHVLRFWETKFPQIRPMKRRGGRRYYRPEDVTLLRQIRNLLYVERYTIKGVQKLLREHGRSKSAAEPLDARPPALEVGATLHAADDAGEPWPGPEFREELRAVIRELEDLRALLLAKLR